MTTLGERRQGASAVPRRGALEPLPLPGPVELEVAWLGAPPEWVLRADAAGALAGVTLRPLAPATLGNGSKPVVLHVPAGELAFLRTLRTTAATVVDCTGGAGVLPRRAARRAAAAALVLVGTAHELGEIRRRYPHLAAKTALLRPPVDLERHAPPDALRRRRPDDVAAFLGEVRGSPPPVLFAGPVREGGGLELLIEAAHILRPRVADVRIAVVPRGRVDPRFLDRCRRSAARRGAGLVVVPRGADAALWCAFSQVVCVPGRRVPDDEPARLAAAAGRPLVAGEAQPLLEAVDDGETAWLVPPDPWQIADALEALLGDEEARRRLGVAARRKVERELSPAAAAARLVELWWRAASQR